MCRFFLDGRCAKGEDCTYAHGVDKLRMRPDFTKTTICREWLQGQCGRSSLECKFAHGEHDLRAVGSTTPLGGSPHADRERLFAFPPTSPSTPAMFFFVCPPCTPNYPRTSAPFRPPPPCTPDGKKTPSSVGDGSTSDRGCSKDCCVTESDEAGGEEVETDSSCKNQRQGQRTVPRKPKNGDKDEKEPHMAS
eukprot:CAMPEP_0195072072 /NCGR_PEP_ID=MMETSP0448-20130528/15737_1 /TAXON_ID=66468 /ORGANISM="Heterocapsa triquestra, Strain CCMP 448" /LENGTH=191 /DNA_ID=CAMNT_0040104011 /DNA_START=94 /DNA_END=666 /DNA_ORIENTATION=+